jgi:transposase
MRSGSHGIGNPPFCRLRSICSTGPVPLDDARRSAEYGAESLRLEIFKRRLSDMALFGARAAKPFRIRGLQRDRETDTTRLSRLCASLDGLRAEIEQERNGLRGRYESVTARAAFSQQALENDQGGPEMSSTVDELTRTMINYTKRLAALEEQIAFVIELRERAGLFPLQKEEVADFAGTPARPPA